MSEMVETDLGLLPESWTLMPVGEAFETQLGKMLSKKARTGTNPKPYLRNKNVQWGHIDTSDLLELDFDEREQKKFALIPGGLLVCEGGVVGRAALWQGDVDDCYFQKALHRLRPVNGSVPNEFMLYWMRFAFEIQNFYGVSGASSTIAHLPAAQLRALELPIPPLPEQKKIAHILSTVQRAIEAQERIIQTTTELKKALMHKLFTEGLRNEPQKQTEIGPVPESWEVVELGEFFQIKHGYAFDGKFFEPSGDYILMTPGHFHEEGEFRERGDRTKYFTGEIPQDYVLAKDDLVVAMTEQKSGLLGSAAIVPDNERYLHNQRLGLIVDLDTKRLSKHFLFNVFNLPRLRVEVAKTSTGSKVKHTSPTKLRDVKVGIPPTLEEQEEIATALSTTDLKIGVAIDKRTQLQDLFRTPLHELMTAKTRVHDLEISPKGSAA